MGGGASPRRRQQTLSSQRAATPDTGASGQPDLVALASGKAHTPEPGVYPMRYLLMATVAASALAIGIGFTPAAAFSPVGKAVGPEGALHKVQHGERGTDAGKGRGNGSRRDGVRSGDGGRDHGRVTQFPSGHRDGHHSHHGRRGSDFGIYVGPSYGYNSDCDWMRRRAVATGSSYWWRRYRACQ